MIVRKNRGKEWEQMTDLMTDVTAIVRVVHVSMARTVEEDMRAEGYSKTAVYDTPRGINGHPHVGEMRPEGHVTMIFHPHIPRRRR